MVLRVDLCDGQGNIIVITIIIIKALLSFFLRHNVDPYHNQWYWQ